MWKQLKLTSLWRSFFGAIIFLPLMAIAVVPNIGAGAGERLRIIQLTDTHLSSEADRAEENLRGAISEINSVKNRPDFVVVTGDLTDGQVASYIRLKTSVQKLLVPVYLLPGNHDNISNLRSVFGSPQQAHNPIVLTTAYSFERGPFLFVMLNSKGADEIKGFLSAKVLRWLSAKLAAHRTSHVFLFLHHNTIPSGPDDDYLLANHGEFEKVVAGNPNVRMIISGHTHADLAAARGGQHYITSKSLGYSFGRISGNIGYRIFEVSEDKVEVWGKQLNQPEVLDFVVE